MRLPFDSFCTAQTLLPRALGIAALACALSACGGGNPRSSVSASQVAVKVNGGEISVHQVDHAVQRHAAGAAGADGVRRVLEGLVDQELAAQQAREQDLDRDPRTVQAIEAARRDILARAYVQEVGQSATLPDAHAVDDYYEKHPALFAQRRLYVLQELVVEGKGPTLVALGERVRAVSGADAVAEAVHDARLASSVNRTARPAEDIALTVLDRLVALRDGQSLWLPAEKGAKIITVITSVAAPMSRTEARPRIQAFLATERQREAVSAQLKNLRQKAQIEYFGRFAPAAAAADGTDPAPGSVTAQR